ncbi:MAG: choice-of-anchor D domain-containing protein [Myxococcales bacterium]|nr:choice-of-anchor D domain-containing protein [Myxococcales bacterium]
MRTLGSRIGRVGALAFSIATFAACGDNGVTPPDAAPDAPLTPAALSMMPMSADFGTVTVNTTSGAQTFTVTNGGQAESGSISAIVSGANAGDFTVQNGCTTLAGGGTCVVSVTFRASTPGAKSGTLVVTGSPGGTAMATLNAAAVAPTALTITGSPFDFGNVVVGTTTTVNRVFTVTNSGGVTSGTLTVTPAGSNPAQFVKTADTCNGQTLAAGANCTFTVNFAPTSIGAKSASFDVSANPGGLVSGAVSGTGINNATIVITPNATDFGSVTVGANSTQSSFVVTNSGGVATGALAAPTLTGAQAAQFNIVSQNCTGVVLQPGGANSCTVIARYSPTATGAAAANLNVTGTPGGTGVANLSGTGNAVGSLTFNPTTHDFLTVNVGAASAPQQFTLSNPGGSPIGPLTLATGGANANQFQIVAGTDTCTGQTLLPTVGTCTISVTFNPTSAGLKNGTLQATAPSGTFSATLTGTGIVGATLSIAPATHDYGSVAIQTNSPYQDFVVTNTGGVASGVPTVALNGTNASEFNIANPPNGGCTAALAPGASCTIQVRFSPVIVSMIAKQATLDVGASPGGNVSAALSGFAISQAQIANTPSALSFNQTLIGDTSVQMITVTNNGAATTGPLMVTIAGANAADYTQTNNCTTLLNGQSCTINVTFAPQGPFNLNALSMEDRRNASVTVTGTPGGTAVTSLTGTTRPRIELLAPSTNPFDFGAVGVSSPEEAVCVNVTVRNNTATTANLALTPTLGTPQQFFPVTNGVTCPTGGYPATFGGASVCGATLGAGASCTIRIAFNPESTGVKTGNVVFAINGGGPNNAVTQQLTGTGGGLTINPCTAQTCVGIQPPITPANPFSYGTINVNNSNFQEFFVDNDTGVATGPMGTRITGPNANLFHIISDTCAGNSVPTLGGCVIRVSFAPTSTGTFTATLITTDSTGAQITSSQNLSGTGGMPAVISVTPNPGNFTAFSGEASTASFTVSSAGGTTSQITITPPGGFYTILGGQPGDCMSGTQTLAAGASCVVRVRYAPTGTCVGTACTSGSNVSQFTVTAAIGAPGGINVALNGTQRNTISLTPATTSYSTVDDGTIVTGAYTVTNNSASTIQIPSIVPMPTGPGTFTVIANTCGGMILPMGTCTFSLQYSSNTAGTIGGVVQVNATTGGLPTGIAQSNLTGTVITRALLLISPPVVTRNFGTVVADAVAMTNSTATFTVTNVGQQTSGVPVVTIGGDPVSFMISTNGCTAGLAQNGTCDVVVMFNPLTTGVKNGTFNVAGSPISPIALTGTGLANTAVTITPAQHVFPSRVVGAQSPPQTFTVNNPTGTAVAIDTTPLNGNTQFTVDPASTCLSLVGNMLNGGASCTFIVRFTPTVVNFNDNVQLTPVAGTFASISGTAVASILDATIAFGPVEIAPSPGRTITYTFTNNIGGNDNLGALSIAISGMDAANFTLQPSSTCPGTDLAQSASCTIVINFLPTTTGPKMAIATVTGTSGATTVLTLTGTGLNHPMVSGSLTAGGPAAQGTRRVGVLDNGPKVYTIVNGVASSNAPTGALSFALSDSTNFKLTVQGVANACSLAGTTTLMTNTAAIAAPPSAGSFCNVGITYSPTTTGAHTTTLTVTDATHASNTLMIPNAVTGTGAETLTAPASIAIGGGTPMTNVNVVFTNNASVPMNAVTVDASMLGTQVSIVTDGCTGVQIPAMGTCTVVIRFVSTGTGFTGASISATGTVSGNNGAALTPPSGYPVNFSRASTATVMLTP